MLNNFVRPEKQFTAEQLNFTHGVASGDRMDLSRLPIEIGILTFHSISKLRHPLDKSFADGRQCSQQFDC